jgi:hypothetical protein
MMNKSPTARATPPSIDGAWLGNLEPLQGANSIFGVNQYGYKTVQIGRGTGLSGQGSAEDDIFGKTASAISYWTVKYGDYRSAWFHGVQYHLEAWLELNEVSTVVRTNSPEMATALGDFIEYHLDN